MKTYRIRVEAGAASEWYEVQDTNRFFAKVKAHRLFAEDYPNSTESAGITAIEEVSAQ